MPVYFACNIDKMRDKKSSILDSNLYNYKEVFNLKNKTKFILGKNLKKGQTSPYPKLSRKFNYQK